MGNSLKLKLVGCCCCVNVRDNLSNPQDGRGGKLAAKFFERANKSAILEAVDRVVKQDQVILEVGFGSGIAAEAMVNKGASLVIGWDISPQMLRMATERNQAAVDSGRVRFVLNNVDESQSDIETGTVDSVFSSHCHYFWKDAPAGFRRLVDCLKPGGSLVTVMTEALPPPVAEDHFKNRYSKEEMTRLYNDLGLQNVAVTDLSDQRFMVVGVKPAV